MDALSLYTELQNRGITLAVSGDKLTYQAAMGALTTDLLASLKEHKQTLIQWEQARTVSTAGQIVTQELTEGQADTPSRQADKSSGPGRGYRPTEEQVNLWQSYYGTCSWYRNPRGDSPAVVALEYITEGQAAACVALFTIALRDFYQQCQGQELTTEQGRQMIEPGTYTDLLRAAWQEQNRAAVLALVDNFKLNGQIDSLQNVIRDWPHKSNVCLSESKKEDNLSSKDRTGQDESDRQAETRQPFGVLFVDVVRGRGITEGGTRFSFPVNCSLSELIAAAAETGPVNRVYICGERPGQGETPESYIDWLMDAGMMERYSTSKIGHYFDLKKPDMSTARYESRGGRAALDIRRINAWLGDEKDSNYTIEDARAALLLTTRVLRQHFPLFKNLSGTPSTTFKYLWEQGNHIAKKQFPPLSEEIRTLIHQNSGQGRIEYFPENCTGRIPGLFYNDGIFMYAALTSELPTEVATHDFINEYAGYVPARYRIRYRVPENWNHIGLFMTKREGADWRDKDGWFYPGQAYQGQEFETWVDGAELHVAMNLPDNMPRWNVTILERIVFKPVKESAVNRPLETVTHKMIEIRNQLDTDKRQDSKHAAIYDLARGCIRNILLHGIGSFNREQKTRTFVLMPGEQPPVPLTRQAEYTTLDDGRQLVNVPEETEPDNMMHPEFCAAVWARARARVTRAALGVAYSDLVTIRTDAIATTTHQEQLEKGEKPGQFRRKWAIEKPLKAPKNHEAFDELQHKVSEK